MPYNMYLDNKMVSVKKGRVSRRDKPPGVRGMRPWHLMKSVEAIVANTVLYNGDLL